MKRKEFQSIIDLKTMLTANHAKGETESDLQTESRVEPIFSDL